MSEYTSLSELSKLNKEQQRILNLERFNILPEEIQILINEERKAGRYADPLQPVSQEQFQDWKNIMTMLAGAPNSEAIDDVSFAKLWRSQEKAGDFFTNRQVQKEAMAIAGGIIGPTFVPGLGAATLPARIAAFAAAHPRKAKMLYAFIGGFGGASPLSENYKEALAYGAREASGEGAFQFLAKIFGKRITKMFRGNEGKNLEDGAAAALKVAEEGGYTITPARLSKSKTIDLMENFAEVSFFGASKIREAGEKGVDAVTGELSKFLNKEFLKNSNKELLESEAKLVKSFLTKASQEEIDDMLKVFLLQGREFYKTAVNGAYKALNKKVATTVGNQAKIIDVSNLKKVLKKQMGIYYGKGINVSEGPINSIKKYIDSLPDKVDFNTAKTIRTFLLGKTGAFQVGGTTADAASKAVAGALQTAVMKNMDDSIKVIVKGGKYNADQIKDIQKLYAQANKLYAEGKETFNTKFITSLLAGDSAGMTKTGLDMTDAIFQNFVKAGKPSRVKALYELLENGVAKKIITKEASDLIKNKVQGQFILNILGPNTDSVSGVVNAKKVIDEISKFKGKGRGIIDALFKGNEKGLGLFQEYLKALYTAQKRGIQSQQGGLALFSGQFKSLGALATTGFGLEFAFTGDASVGSTTGIAVGAATLVLGGPYLIAKAFSNPKFVNNLMNMTLAKSGSSQYGRIFTRFINDGLEIGVFDYVNAGKVVQEQKLNGFLNEVDLKKFPWLKDYIDETDEEIIDPDVNNIKNFEKDVQEETNEVDTDQDFLDSINSQGEYRGGSDEEIIEEEIIDIPEPNTEMMSTEVIQPLSTPAGMPFDPEMSTTDKLEEVGMPMFANEGGIASLCGNKKPQQMVA
tara:strand:+ start:2930 stop:5509 length:2580 start_codon:yes stop_codon:yes gene_type:complete